MTTQFCNYTLLNQLGSGGASTVYRAQTRNGQVVALKMLAPYLLHDQEARARFSRQIMLNPPHPNIVPILEAGECPQSKGPSVPFIVMAYISGEPLDAVIARMGKLTPAQLLPILKEIAAAMDAAHAAGIIHRDIKPANVLMRTDGHAFLSDFGIARAINMAGLTRAGNAFIGTAAYMSPEQAKGLSLTAASDIYSLGILTYQALSGRLPFMADNEVAVARMHVQDPPATLKQIVPEISGAISAVVMRALNKDPRRRYVSAGMFAESFERAVLGVSTSRVIVSGVTQAAKRSPLALIVGVTALLIALALGFLLLRGDGDGKAGQNQPQMPSVIATRSASAATDPAVIRPVVPGAIATSTLMPTDGAAVPRAVATVRPSGTATSLPVTSAPPDKPQPVQPIASPQPPPAPYPQP